MCGRLSPARIALFAFIFAVAATNAIDAQQFDRYRNFQYDTLFRIGAHFVPGDPRIARDSLGLEFTYHYSQTYPSSIASPNGWSEELDSLLYFLPHSTDSLKTIFQPRIIEKVKHMVLAADNVPYHNTDVQVFTFGQIAGAPAELQPIDIGNDPTLYRTLDAPAGDRLLVVGRPPYISTNGFRLSDVSAYSDTNAAIFFDIGNGNPTLGRDSAHMVRFSFHIDVTDDDVADSAVIAYARLWRRVYSSDTCDCAIYVPFRTDSITYGQYLASNDLPAPLDQFRNVGFWFDMRDTSQATIGWYDSTTATRYYARPGVWSDRDTSSACDTLCLQLLASTKAAGDTLAEIRDTAVTASDIYYDFYSTGVAPIRFLRGRVAMHEFEALMNHRLGRFIDDEIKALLDPVGFGLDTLAARTAIRNRMYMIGMQDEPYTPEFEAYAFLADTLQDLIEAYNQGAHSPSFRIRSRTMVASGA
jgi:hypothetical protein